MPDNIDTTIYRYLTSEKLESLLKTKSLYFARADLLGDDHEGSYSHPTINRRPIFFEGATKHFIEKGLPEMNKNWRQCTFINSWHINTSESVAMWKIYSKENKAIAIRSSIASLKRAVLNTEKEFMLHPIKYVDYDFEYIPEGNAFNGFFYKQKAYEHEKEFRIATDHDLEKFDDISRGKYKPEKGILIDVDLDILINAIIISPYAELDFQNIVKDMLKKYKLFNKLIPSKILREPTF